MSAVRALAVQALTRVKFDCISRGTILGPLRSRRVRPTDSCGEYRAAWPEGSSDEAPVRGGALLSVWKLIGAPHFGGLRRKDGQSQHCSLTELGRAGSGFTPHRTLGPQGGGALRDAAHGA